MNKENIGTKKVFTSIFLLLVIVLSVLIYLDSLKNDSQVVNMHLDLVEHFDSIETLKSESSLIAHVDITESKTFEYENVPFTLSKANIKKLYKGNEEKTQINILETGGNYDKINYLSDGNAVFKKSDQAIVFLEKYIGPVTEDSYVIKGVYQGKFKFNGSNLLPPIEASGELLQVKTLQDLQLK